MKIKPHASGFTLIEMLIALVILSISFSAIILSVNQNVRTLLKLQDTVAAGYVAEEIISRTQLGLLRANSGTQRMLNRNWRWELHGKATPNAQVQEIEVSVYNQQQNKVVTVTAYTGVSSAS